MSDPKDGNESFFRKVVRFVANPATDWADLNSRQDSSDLDLEKSELKAMIERKRRNDFVRKREFDMLRKVRREGLSSEQLAALAGSSRLDDSEARLSDSAGARADNRVKAKIDEIEQQMVGEGSGLAPAPRRTQAGALAPAAPLARLPSAASPRGPVSTMGPDSDQLPRAAPAARRRAARGGAEDRHDGPGPAAAHADVDRRHRRPGRFRPPLRRRGQRGRA